MCGLPNELIPIRTYPRQRGRKSATTDLAHHIMWVVVEQPDHYCSDDFVLHVEAVLCECKENA